MFVCWALNRRHFIKTYVCDTRTCDRIMPSLLTVISRYTSSVTLSNATLETNPPIEYNFSQHDLYVEQNRSHQCGCFVWVRHHITRVIEMWMIPAAAHIHRQASFHSYTMYGPTPVHKEWVFSKRLKCSVINDQGTQTDYCDKS